MATTPNFNWSTPDNTGLVKNGALDIRTLGNSIDASMADLKGGTTGQVLKKATNTDMDFVWSSDSAGMTNPMTTTGDTIYSSSGSTPARLGIGSTGQVLTVSGGVPSWATPSAGSSGLTLITTQSFSAASSVNVNDCFSSTYDHYKVIVSLTAASGVINVFGRLRVSGADNTTSNYSTQRFTVSGTSAAPFQYTNQTSFEFTDLAQTDGTISSEFYNPFASKGTNVISQMNAWYPAEYWVRSSSFNATTSFTGFSLLTTSSTITGTVSVWGYSK